MAKLKPSHIEREREGLIVAKFKVLEDIYDNKDAIVYLVNYDERCTEDFVFEEDILEKIIDYKKRYLKVIKNDKRK